MTIKSAAGQKHHCPHRPEDQRDPAGEGSNAVSESRDGSVGFALGQQTGTLQSRTQGEIEDHGAYGGDHAVDEVYIFGQEYTVAQALTKIAGGVTFVNSVASTVCVVILYLALRPALERAGLLPKDKN